MFLYSISFIMRHMRKSYRSGDLKQSLLFLLRCMTGFQKAIWPAFWSMWSRPSI